MIVLTPEGTEAREGATELLYEPLPSFRALIPSEVRQLRDLLRKVIAAERASGTEPREAPR